MRFAVSFYRRTITAVPIAARAKVTKDKSVAQTHRLLYQIKRTSGYKGRLEQRDCTTNNHSQHKQRDNNDNHDIAERKPRFFQHEPWRFSQTSFRSTCHVMMVRATVSVILPYFIPAFVDGLSTQIGMVFPGGFLGHPSVKMGKLNDLCPL